MKKIIEKLKACKGYVSLSNEECDKIVPILESSELLQETLQEVQVTLGKLQEKANDGANGIIIEGVKYTLVRDKDMSSIDTSLKCDTRCDLYDKCRGMKKKTNCPTIDLCCQLFNTIVHHFEKSESL